jgi:hypothetical protein
MKIPCKTCISFAICYPHYKEYKVVPHQKFFLLYKPMIILPPKLGCCKILKEYLETLSPVIKDGEYVPRHLDEVLPLFKTGEISGKPL